MGAAGCGGAKLGIGGACGGKPVEFPPGGGGGGGGAPGPAGAKLLLLFGFEGGLGGFAGRLFRKLLLLLFEGIYGKKVGKVVGFCTFLKR